jgi:hypothetical protein
MKQFYLLGSFWKQKKNSESAERKKYLSELDRRLQYCLRNPRIACKKSVLQYGYEFFEIEETYCICDPYTHEGLSHYSIPLSAQSKSGATVPLTHLVLMGAV